MQEGLDVAERLRGLVGDVVTDKLAGLRIESALASQEDPAADCQPWRVRAAGAGAPAEVMSSFIAVRSSRVTTRQVSRKDIAKFLYLQLEACVAAVARDPRDLAKFQGSRASPCRHAMGPAP